MKIHEYQGKRLLAKYGISIPAGEVAYTVREAVEAARTVGGPAWAVKAQIHAGGRSRGHFQGAEQNASGVRIVDSVEAVATAAEAMIGRVLITPLTGPAGQEVKRVYVENACPAARMYRVCLSIDRSDGLISLGASLSGEEDGNPAGLSGNMVELTIDPVGGFCPHHGRAVASGLKLGPDAARNMNKVLEAMYRALTDCDATSVEINPLGLTDKSELVALDAKVIFDDSALYRHKDVEDLRDEAEEDPIELAAARNNLNYVKMKGTIGCMVNGAGLAMATTDIIKLYGGEPANFLDVGGGATKERVTTAFKLILSDPHVEGILVNIFGGIMRCDLIAESIVGALREVSLNVPLVVRLEGTNGELGKKILSQSGLPIIAAKDLADAAEKVVTAVRDAT